MAHYWGLGELCLAGVFPESLTGELSGEGTIS